MDTAPCPAHLVWQKHALRGLLASGTIGLPAPCSPHAAFAAAATLPCTPCCAAAPLPLHAPAAAAAAPPRRLRSGRRRRLLRLVLVKDVQRPGSANVPEPQLAIAAPCGAAQPGRAAALSGQGGRAAHCTEQRWRAHMEWQACNSPAPSYGERSLCKPRGWVPPPQPRSQPARKPTCHELPLGLQRPVHCPDRPPVARQRVGEAS